MKSYFGSFWLRTKIAYPEVIVGAASVQVVKPFASDELPVSHQVIDGVLAVKALEAAHKFDPLGCVGVAYLVHHGVYYRKSHPAS